MTIILSPPHRSLVQMRTNQDVIETKTRTEKSRDNDKNTSQENYQESVKQIAQRRKWVKFGDATGKGEPGTIDET